MKSVPVYPDHSKLMEVRGAGVVRPVKTAEDWSIRRGHILLGMQEVMGPLPVEKTSLRREIVETTEAGPYIRYKLFYQPELDDRVPAYLLVPNDLQRKAPAVLCLHQTVPIGKGEPAGLGQSKTLRYADELARRGYICLAPDYPSFGDYKYDFKKSKFQSGSMKAIWNNIRAVDLLCEWPEVDPKRIGCIGHSLGGHNTLFTGVFEPRIGALVSCCGFTAFGKYYGGNLTGWSSDRYMPKIPSYGGWRNMPFDFHEVVAALAPRPFLAVAPKRDSNFDIDGVKEVMAAASQVYALLGARDKLIARYPDAEHAFPDADRLAAYHFFDQNLKMAE